VAVTTVQLVLANPNSDASSAMIAVMMGAVIGIYILAVRTLAFTRCTDTGIHTRRLVRTRCCPWNQISDIRAESFVASRGGHARKPYRLVRVTTTSGRTFRLAAPFDGLLTRDPEFDSALMTIQE